MGRHVFPRAIVLFAVSVLALTVSLTVFVQTASAALTLENVKTWYWTDYTEITSVARADVDGDGVVEIVTGGDYRSGVANAQLCVWNGPKMALENIRTWHWTGDTLITSVAVGNVDADGSMEIVTGGYYFDGTRYVAQLCVWDATLGLKNVKTWYQTDDTQIRSLTLGDVDGDGQMEIITGGWYNDGTRHVAQLCVWNGQTLTLENVRTWYWTSNTEIQSVAIGNVDNDLKMEIVTGGRYEGAPYDRSAQLCVWDGATLALENVKTWHWTGNTEIQSVAVGDVDGDAAREIVTGGFYWDYTNEIAQLCVWNGASLALENIRTWYWTSYTHIESVQIGNVDADAQMEIITGGYYNDGTHYHAQLCVWNGATMALENIQTWLWASQTCINSITVYDIEGDAKIEIMTGGYYYDGTRDVAQLCVWG